MRAFDNWDSIQEAGEFDHPVPGAYIARIAHVRDEEKKEYLRVEWDFAEGDYEGENARTAARLGFWPTALIRSYKKSAESFFKAFITAVEESNSDFRFSPLRPNPASLEGKRMGVVLGEEEYVKKTGEVGKRLYVHQVRSLEAVRTGDFKIPTLKKLEDRPRPSRRPAVDVNAGDWEDAEDGDLPF